MEIANLVKPDAVKVVSNASSKKRLLQEVAELASSAHGIEERAALDALMDRESLGPTGVGHGVALPHARLETLDHVVGVFILLEKPIDFSAVDHQPVDLIFGLFAPENAGVEHLKSLAAVSRLLKSNDVCAKLRANTDATTLYTILTETISQQAA